MADATDLKLKFRALFAFTARQFDAVSQVIARIRDLAARTLSRAESHPLAQILAHAANRRRVG